MNSELDSFTRKWNNAVKATEAVAKRIKLTRFGHLARNSRETLCYSAEVRIDGVLVGTACNDGNGGETNLYIGSTEEARRLYASVVAEIKDAISGGDCPASYGVLEIVDALADKAVDAKKRKAFIAKCSRKGFVTIITRMEMIGVHPSRCDIELDQIKKTGGTVVEVVPPA